MKIGIVTLERYWMLRNYGTLLQCYALQTILQRMGHAPLLVQRLDARERAGKKARLLHGLSELRHPLSALRARSSVQVFSRFLQRHIAVTDKCYSDPDLETPPFEADAFICGSDQVWSHCGRAAFLSFVPHGRRIAYAPSAPWAECDSDWRALAAESLPGFAGISVREDAGAELLGGMGIRATVAADPVLLLQREDYAELMPPSRHSKPYMLVYTLNLSNMQDIFWYEAKRYAAEHHLDMVVIARQGAEKLFPAKMLCSPAPGELLRLFADAACVVTNSFHGTAFSLLFNRPFAVALQQGRTAAQNTRFRTALARTRQVHRVACRAEELPLLFESPPAEAKAALDEWRGSSLRFLQESLDRVSSLS